MCENVLQLLATTVENMDVVCLSDLMLNLIFYSEIPLPFPNSSYLLEPSNPMANAEMRFLRLYNNLNKAIGLQ